ncbi:MAG TPA: hypothetical protein VG322_09965 [Candidatus Acidoferrales bacterium]|nr:hypothetical protein [Candidatus Acidoferrales bacterium]
MTTNGIRRTSPPQAVQKIRDGVFLLQVGISESPSADWRRLFYDAQQEVSPDFPPRSVEITGTFLRFKADPGTVEQKIGVLDRWMDRASQKEASMAGRSTELQRQKKEEVEREAQEIAEWNARWAKL